MKVLDFKKMSIAELENEMYSLLKEQFTLNMQRASGQLAKPHLMKNARRNIARIKTIITEKQVSNDE